MNDLRIIVNALESTTESFVMATVVESKGSTYRGIGARMLFKQATNNEWDEWTMLGTISGGCLEHDVLEHAKQVMETGEPKLLTYDSLEEDEDLLWGMGLGCNGIVKILLELVDFTTPLIRFFSRSFHDEQHGVVATVFSSINNATALGSRIILQFDSEVFTTLYQNIPHKSLQTLLIEQARSAFISGTSKSIVVGVEGASIQALVEIIQPPQPLVVFGAGFDAIPVVQIASLLGWHTTVADYRPVYVTGERFPFADKLILAPQEEIFDELVIPTGAAVLIMTHKYEFDCEILKKMLSRTDTSNQLSYIGVLGPRKRIEKLLADLYSSGIELTDQQQQNLYSPVGLDIGTETAEEVALSIIAEIQSVLSSRQGGFLRHRSENIHVRS